VAVDRLVLPHVRKRLFEQVIAPPLAKELEVILTIKEVTRNKDLLGDYAEAH
jgi:hypothetical protein